MSKDPATVKDMNTGRHPEMVQLISVFTLRSSRIGFKALGTSRMVKFPPGQPWSSMCA